MKLPNHEHENDDDDEVDDEDDDEDGQISQMKTPIEKIPSEMEVAPPHNSLNS